MTHTIYYIYYTEITAERNTMREVQITSKYKLREDGKLININDGSEFIPAKGNWTGYRIAVYVNDKRTIKYIHWLVLTHFGPPCPGPGYVASHINKDEYDNRLENLEWMQWKDVCARRCDALPVGQRRCDFDNINDYYCNNTKRYQSKNKEKIKATLGVKHNVVSNINYHNDEEKRRKHREACKRYEESHKEELKEKRKIAWKKWYAENKETYKLTRKRNKEKEAECSKNWRKNNKEKYKLIQKLNNEKNKEQRTEYNRKWRAEHPENIKEYKEREKEWYKEHPDYKKEYYLKRSAEPGYKEHLYEQANERNRIKRERAKELP